MKSRSGNFLVTIISLVLLVGLALTEHSTAQNPTPKTTSPEGALAQTPEKQRCEELKRQIEDLEDALVDLANELVKLQQGIDRLDQSIQKHDQYLKDHPIGVKLYDLSGGNWEGTRLDLLAARRKLKNHLEEDKDTIKAIRGTITDLLNKLGNCGSKTLTTTPSLAPTPSPTPTSNPAENKKVALLPGYHIGTNTANGLFVTTFDTPQGKIKVNLTDDVAAGDTISGTVETEPAGKNDAERAQNQAELNGYVIEMEGQKTKVGRKEFTCNIPTVLTPEAKTIVLQHNGQTVATTDIPISATPPPAPAQFTLPTGGQQGKPIYIKGPCDGAFSPQDHIKVGPTILPPVAESPRSLVVLNLSDVVGPTNIDCNENGVETQCPFHNIRVNLSALRLNLQRGETTTLHVHVLGLAGITEDEPLDLEDNTPSVIKMSGGEIQHIIIHPAEVQRDGTYSTDRTLTGIMAGGFGVTGTVRWSDVCTHPAVSAGIPFLTLRIERRAARRLSGP